MKVLLKNRSDNPIGYDIPDMHLHRDFAPYEEKEVDKSEIEKLSYQPGGQILLDSYFQISDKTLANEISPHYANEPEYNYTKEDIIRIITEGSLDEFLDCLDYAPEGVSETIKNLSITLPCTDTRKMDALGRKYGVNIAAAIANYQASKEDNTTSTSGVRARRVPVNTEESNYKVVNRRQN